MNSSELDTLVKEECGEGDEVTSAFPFWISVGKSKAYANLISVMAFIAYNTSRAWMHMFLFVIFLDRRGN